MISSTAISLGNIVLIFFLYPCTATFIVKYQNVLPEFLERLHSGGSDVDFLETSDFSQRQSICEEVLDAREYVMAAYGHSETSVENSKVQDVAEANQDLSLETSNQEGMASTTPSSSNVVRNEESELADAETVSSEEHDAASENSPEAIPRTVSDTPAELSADDQDAMEELAPNILKIMYKYKKRKIHARHPLSAKAVKCSRGKQTEIFLTYGLRRTDLFLLEYRRRARGLVVRALIPTSASFSTYNSPSPLLTSFLRNLEIGDDKLIQVPQNMHLCFFNRVEHLRLCASIFDTLISRDYFASDVRQVNSVTVDRRVRCHLRTIRMNANIRLVGRVVPCAINKTDRYSWDSQFYVLPDLQGTASAYVLTQNEGDTENPEDLKVVAKIENVDVLFGRDYNSEVVMDSRILRVQVDPKDTSRRRHWVHASSSGQNIAAHKQVYVRKDSH